MAKTTSPSDTTGATTETTEIDATKGGELVTMTPEALTAALEDAAIKGGQKAIGEFMMRASDNTEDAISGAMKGGVGSPMFYVKGPKNPWADYTDDTRGCLWARAHRMQALASQPGGGNLDSTAAQFAKAAGGETAKALEYHFSGKALEAGTLGSGGDLVQTSYAEVVPLLYNQTVVLQSGATRLNMQTGSMTLPRLTQGAQASYTGESRVMVPSNLKTASAQAVAHKLTALSIVSNDMFRYPTVDVDVLVRNDIAQSSSIAMDRAGIFGDGTDNSPRGVLAAVDAGNVFNSTGVTVAQITTDLNKAKRLLLEANIPEAGCVWWISPRTYAGLMSALTTTGAPVFSTEMNTGKLLGLPFFVTNQIPSNVTVSNYSYIFLVHGPSLWFLPSIEVPEVNSFRGGAIDNNGTPMFGISNDSTVITSISAHDYHMKYAKAAAVIQNVTIA